MSPLIRKIVPGDIIGRCRIIRELGRGGVGTVYLAAHQTLRIDVAIKILSPALSLDNPALGERFIREAQLAARIRHPNVVAVMDAAHDEASGAYFIVMEYINGGSLAWHLRNGPLPEPRALAIITGIAQALVLAEENHVVHRDIKPENIMLDTRGVPKLADLGLAKHVIDSRTSITIGGSFMGTPAYMSPEQAKDAKVADTRDDIYSLGASFYECLTGVPPFQGETPYNIMSELLTKPSPRPRDLRPELGVAIDLVCRKMMAKNRALRYATARDLLSDLHHVQSWGDRRNGELGAANFEQEADLARRDELNLEARYGIATSSEGVYAEPIEAEVKPSISLPARSRDRDVFRAAAVLISLVLVTTLLLTWAGPFRTFEVSRVKSALAVSPNGSSNAPALVPTPPTKEKAAKTPEPAKPRPTTKETEVRNPDATASVAPEKTEPFTAVPTSPVALPVDPSAQAQESVPLEAAVPVPPVLSLSAFAAREIAEHALDPKIILPTGRAGLLKIVGKREEGAVTPPTWTFYFYDKSAVGNARLVTVSEGKVSKNGEDLVDSLSPYSERLILPEGQMQKDSADALQIAEGLLPGITVTSSEFVLMQQKNSVPMWRVTLWGKAGEEQAKKRGEITLLAESGTVISRNLKP